MPDLVVTVWGAQFSEFGDLDYQQKIANLCTTAATAHAKMRAAAHRNDIETPVTMFVVPEYYFVRDRDKRPLTKDQDRGMVGALRALSASLPNMILVPGSLNFSTLLGDFVKASVVAGRDERTKGVFSHCPIFHNGDLLIDYYKRTNDDEYDVHLGQHDAYFVPGARAATFKCGHLRMGVDICKDYGQGKLAGDVPTRDLDVHVCVSGTHVNVFDRPNIIAAKDGGYFIHADCDDDPRADGQKNGVWRVERGHGEHGPGGRRLSLSLAHRALRDDFIDGTDEHRDLVLQAVRNRHERRSGDEVTKNVTRLRPIHEIDTQTKIYHCPLG